MDGKYWARVSKRGITERKRATIESPTIERSRISSDNELFLMRTSKGHNPAIRGQIKKR